MVQALGGYEQVVTNTEDTFIGCTVQIVELIINCYVLLIDPGPTGCFIETDKYETMLLKRFYQHALLALL